MTAMNTMNNTRCSCSSAAACICMPVVPVMDTAIILAVSICVPCLCILRISLP